MVNKTQLAFEVFCRLKEKIIYNSQEPRSKGRKVKVPMWNSAQGWSHQQFRARRKTLCNSDFFEAFPWGETFVIIHNLIITHFIVSMVVLMLNEFIHLLASDNKIFSLSNKRHSYVFLFLFNPLPCVF